MEIRKFTIKGLFGHLNHTIDIADSINIIMGDNGVGKTVTLRLLKAIYEGNIHYILHTEFKSIEVLFASRKAGRLIYSKDSGSLIIKSSSKSYTPIIVSSEDIICLVPSHYKVVAQGRWMDTQTKDILTDEELEQRLDSHLYSVKDGVVADWYKKLFENACIHMVRTQRLYHFSELSNSGNILTIKTYAEELKNYLNTELASAGKQAAEKDSTYPIRLVKHLKANKNYTMSELEADFNQLKNTQELLSDVGFINVESLNLEELGKAKDKDKRVLMNVFKLYIADNIEKLSYYKTAADRVSLFRDIINKHLKAKSLVVSPECGFCVKDTITGKGEIGIDMLSSGEQNEIILIYELIFQCNGCNLVLIDEPEISLHLEWLQSMLDDFKDIFNQTETKMLIATHSPDFVGDNYSLVQNLSYE